MTGPFAKRPLLPVMVCILLAACGGMPTRGTSPAAAPGPATEERLPVYVVKRSWHVDIGVAVSDLKPPLLAVAAALEGSRYLFFGFGDRGYLLHGGVGNMVAALWGRPGLILVTSLSQSDPADVFGLDSVVRLALRPEQMQGLQAFIGRSLATHDGAFIAVAPGSSAVGAYNAYYESVPHYSGLHTCNTWAAEALKSAQLPLSSSGVEFAWQLWEQVRRLENEGAPTSSEVRPKGLRGPAPQPQSIGSVESPRLTWPAMSILTSRERGGEGRPRGAQGLRLCR